MSEIDRRTLISMATMTSAGLALAGCGAETEDPGNGNCGGGTLAGSCDLWGDSVNQGPPDYPPPDNSNAKFTPTYICAAYIKFDNAGLVIRHGYVPYTTQGEENQNIVNLLKVLKDPMQSNPPIKALYIRDGFKDFGMSGQHVVTVYIDNPDTVARFVKIDDVKNDPKAPKEEELLKELVKEHIVRFTKYSGKNRAILEENKAFYDLVAINMVGTGLDGPVAYRMNYYSMDKYRKAWSPADATKPNTQRLYSMNIHLLVNVGASMLPIIIDPDTGNMGAQP